MIIFPVVLRSFYLPLSSHALLHLMFSFHHAQPFFTFPDRDQDVTGEA